MFRGDSKSNSSIVLHRPQSAYSIQDKDLIQKCNDALGITSDPLDRLRLLCLSRGASGILALARIFRRMDDDDSKQLNQEEFLSGLKETGLDINEAMDLFNKFDTDGTGSISLDEFLKKIRPPISEARRAIVEQAFQKLDKTGEGVINIKDIRRVYSVTAHPSYMNGDDSAETILTNFLAHFEAEGCGDGKITREDFLNYYSGISIAVENDCYFNLMMRQAYKL